MMRSRSLRTVPVYLILRNPILLHFFRCPFSGAGYYAQKIKKPFSFLKEDGFAYVNAKNTKLTMTNDGAGAVTMDDIDVKGTATVTTGAGDLSLNAGNISGSLKATSNGAGSITATDVDVSGTANLKTDGAGAITVDDLNVSTNANATITTNGKGDI